MKFPIDLKENLREEDNLSTRDNWPVPNVSFVRRFYCTLFYGRQYRAENGSMRTFGTTNPHSTAFAPKQWLYQKKATGLESSKMYCPTRCRNSTYQCGAANYYVSWVAVYRAKMEVCEPSGLPIPIVPRLHQSNSYIKKKLRVWIAQKCIALVGAKTVHTIAGPKTTRFH